MHPITLLSAPHFIFNLQTRTRNQIFIFNLLLGSKVRARSDLQFATKRRRRKADRRRSYHRRRTFNRSRSRSLAGVTNQIFIPFNREATTKTDPRTARVKHTRTTRAITRVPWINQYPKSPVRGFTPAHQPRTEQQIRSDSWGNLRKASL
ncbi:hypothetical protein Q3G72_035689 [Acer saccharum]|nr:hypothetical protein Q3G72_035689 [Acer saccharum]